MNFLVFLLMIFTAEAAIMNVLPTVVPAGSPRLVAALLDAATLAVVIAPVAWWLFVVPLQRRHAERVCFSTGCWRWSRCTTPSNTRHPRGSPSTSGVLDSALPAEQGPGPRLTYRRDQARVLGYPGMPLGPLARIPLSADST